MGYLNYRTRRLPFAFRYMMDLGRYRHLALNLVASDLRSRFRRSRLGILWATIQPLAFALMIALVYGRLMGQNSFWDYTLYVFSGMIVWDYFTTVTGVSLDALINAQGYLKQSRIPLFVFQLRVPLGSAVIFMSGYVGLLILQLALGRLPPLGLHWLLVPAFLVMFFLMLTPISIIFSILGTQFRDIKYVTMIVLQAMFFVSPVMLLRDFLDRPDLRFLHYANPMIPMMDMFRRPAVDGLSWDSGDVLVVVVWTVALWAAAFIISASVRRRIIFAI